MTSSRSLSHLSSKSLERLIRSDVKDRANRSIEDAIAVILHTVLSHLEQREGYLWMLCVDSSSVFNTIIPRHPGQQTVWFGTPPTHLFWVKDFPTNTPHTVELGPHLFSTRTLSTSFPQPCPLNNTVVKFADDTKVVSLISTRRDLITGTRCWRCRHGIQPKTGCWIPQRPEEIILDSRKNRADSPPAPTLTESLYGQNPFLHLSGDHNASRHVLVQKHCGSSEGPALPALSQAPRDQ